MMSKFGVTKIQSEEGIFHGSARPVKTHVGACQATGVTVGRASIWEQSHGPWSPALLSWVSLRGPASQLAWSPNQRNEHNCEGLAGRGRLCRDAGPSGRSPRGPCSTGALHSRWRKLLKGGAMPHKAANLTSAQRLTPTY